jgi:hypothetical protein
MKMMRRLAIGLLLLAGCAAPTRVQNEKPATPVAAVLAHPPRDMIVYVPQTDEAAAAWLKWFVKYPNLRMVIAMSPRFLRLTKEPALKAQVQTLIKQGRLELGLQIPNAPLLPLLVDTNSAKDALPAGSALPSPAYAYPEDLTQLIAQAKADFFRQWTFLPKGLVLPYGAASPQLFSLLERLGFSWTVAALGAQAIDGPYQSGALAVWDGASMGASRSTIVHVWDERVMTGHPLEAWVQEMKIQNGAFLLPSDAGLVAQPFGAAAWRPRTWTDTSWSMWIGQPDKNAAWNALRKTREALEVYKNSGQASVQRLDAAFSEIYGAQNSNYFASMGSMTQSPAVVEEHQHEFQATLSSVYRLIGRQPPDDLFQASTSGTGTAVHPSSTTIHAEVLADGREHVHIEDAVGDAMGAPGAPDLQSLDVWASSDAVRWVVTLASMTAASIDIYVDLNGQPNAGTPTFLPGRGFVTSPIDAWEYAIAISGSSATLYRTQGLGAYNIIQMFPVTVQGNSLQVTIPGALIHGSPRRWGYQVLVMVGNPLPKAVISDFIDPLEISQKDLWQDLMSGKRSDIPFVRVHSR